MAVYVDNMRAPFGRMVMCHCWADTRQELFAMMDTIGVASKWFQQPPKASWEHFDISLNKRALAVAAGAIETDRYGPLEGSALQLIRSATTVEQIAFGVDRLERVGRIRIK